MIPSNWPISRLRLGPIIVGAAFVVAEILVAGVFAPSFLSLENLKSIVFSSLVLWPAAIGMQTVLIVGRFDLSVGAISAFSGVVAARVYLTTGSAVVAVIGGTLVAVVLGGVNGVFVSYLGLEPFLVTLATMGIWRSGALILAGGGPVDGFFSIDLWRYGIQDAIISEAIVCVGALAICSVALLRVLSLRRFFAVGDNEPACESAGIDVRRSLFVAFVLSGFGAGITGIYQAGRAMVASPLIFQDLPLEVIAACVLGGGSLRGGRGSYLGAVFGVLVMVSLRNLVVALGASVYWRQLILGAIILVALLSERHSVGSYLSNLLRKQKATS